MQTDPLTDVKRLARDLRQEEPRSPDVELGGLEGGARVLDKCRASIVGWQGEFMFGCPFDRSFARNAGIDLDQFREFVASGSSDEEVSDWLRLHARPGAANRSQ